MTPDDIKNHRRRLGYSRRELAQLLGISKHTLDLWEQGHRACKLPVILGLALSSLTVKTPPQTAHTRAPVKPAPNGADFY